MSTKREAKRVLIMLHKRTKPRRVDKGKAAGTRSKVRKGPARDEKHLAKVRRQDCLACVVYHYVSGYAVEAHHVRCLKGRTMGRRPSDYLTTPLCRFHHQDSTFGVHAENEAEVWKRWEIDPAAWIAAFSKEGRQAIEQLREET